MTLNVDGYDVEKY